jgi:methionyl-tRNA formyltransferase
MKIAWIGGDQRRHLYYINEIAKVFPIVGGIMQQRESGPEPTVRLSKIDQDNMTRHFAARRQAEEVYYGSQEVPTFPILKVNKDTLNDWTTANYIKDLHPDLVLVFGPGMIREPLVAALPKDTFNLHLGLSPRYRGAATLFWPFYMLEPNWAGTTLHRIISTPDGGSIIHQSVPDLDPIDGIHDVACKALMKATEDIIRLLKMYPNWKEFPQKPEAGKNFLESDFKPQHLRMIYNTYDNNIVKKYLEGEIVSKAPQLKTQW